MVLISKILKLRICYFIVILMMIIIFDVKVNAQELRENEEENVRVVATVEEFHAAMENSSVNVIEVNGTLSPLKGSGNDPLIIKRPLTIRGGALDLWYLGIVLGADVTFQNIEINMASPESNAIVANGYTLTLDRVTKGSNVKWDMHVFCGRMVGYNYANIPNSGSNGKVIVKGTTHIGNIYAGNLVHSNVSESSFSGNAAIVIDSTATGTIGNIYGSGGKEVMGEGDGNAVNPGIGYKVNGDIDVTIYDSVSKSVVGYEENLTVEFQGSGNEASPVLENITSLEVVSGLLKPKENSNFIPVLPEITVAEQGTLNLSNYQDMYIGNFNGGGTLVLGKEQKITLEGNISGSTQVFIDSHMFPQMPADNHTYIEAVIAGEENFSFQGSNANPGYVPFFVSNNAGGGIWTTIEDMNPEEPAEPVIKITDFNIEDYSVKEIDSFWDWIELPMTVAYTPESNISIDEIPLEVYVNDKEATLVQEGDYYCYQTDQVYCYPHGMAGMWIVYDASYTTVPQEGVYQFKVTVPAEYTASGSPLTTEATLVLGDVEQGGDDENGENGGGDDSGENGGGNTGGEGTGEEVPEGIRVEGIAEGGYEYTGRPVKPNISVYDGKYKLRNRVDYTVTYKNNVNANVSIDGTKLNENDEIPTLIIKGKGNYEGNISVTFDIYPKNIATVTVADVHAVANGKVQLVKPIVKDGKKTLRKDYQYTIEYPNLDEENEDAYKAIGAYQIVLRGKGNYRGTKEITLFIEEKKMVPQTESNKTSVQPDSGEATEQASENPVEQTVQNAAENPVTENQKEEEKQVVQKSSDSYDIRKVKITVSAQTYSPDGVTLNEEDIKVISGQQDVEYEIIGYDRNNRRGTALVILKGTGKYDGVRVVKFKIKAKKLEITRAVK